jgi:hypothetical protein
MNKDVDITIYESPAIHTKCVVGKDIRLACWWSALSRRAEPFQAFSSGHERATGKDKETLGGCANPNQGKSSSPLIKTDLVFLSRYMRSFPRTCESRGGWSH